MENDNGFERYGNAELHKRYMQNTDSGSRKKCHCGCGKKATKLGMANGVCLSIGCDLYIRRWIRDGVDARTINK